MYGAVMIVDDSMLELFITETRMKQWEFAKHILVFNSGIPALAYLQSLENNVDLFPEIIFLDIYMPLMTGFEFIDKFLEFSDEIIEQCKIVIFSSTDAPEDHARMKEYPIIRKFLTKPLSEKMLNELVL